MSIHMSICIRVHVGIMYVPISNYVSITSPCEGLFEKSVHISARISAHISAHEYARVSVHMPVQMSVRMSSHRQGPIHRHDPGGLHGDGPRAILSCVRTHTT